MLLPLACLLPVQPVQRVLLIAAVLLTMIVELLNSGVEAAIDRIGLDTHRLSKRAKDLGSAAVLLTLVLPAATWAMLAGRVLPGLLQAEPALKLTRLRYCCRLDESCVARSHSRCGSMPGCSV